MKEAGAPLRVAMMPCFRAGNPYQSILSDALERVGVTVFFPPGYRRILPLWRAVSRSGADVLHLHWLSPYLKGKNLFEAAVYAVKLCCDLLLVRMSGIGMVWTIHNEVSHEARFPAIEQLVQNVISRFAGTLIVHSEAARRSMIAGGLPLDTKRLRIIPHGHYAGTYGDAVPPADARRELCWEPDKLVFLYFGMVRPYKNVDGLIQAWRSLPALAERATLVIAGEAADPTYRRRIENLAEGLAGVILRLKRIPDEQVHLYFSGSDFVVLPFDRILTSGSLLLAISFGKPIIAPKLETVSETLRGADDLIYDNSQENGLREALEFAASPQVNPADLSRRVQGLCDELGWDRIALLTKSAYESALGR